MCPADRCCRCMRSQYCHTSLLRPLRVSEHFGRKTSSAGIRGRNQNTYIRCATPPSALRASDSPWTAAAISGKVVFARSAHVAGKYIADSSAPTSRTRQHQRSAGNQFVYSLRMSADVTGADAFLRAVSCACLRSVVMVASTSAADALAAAIAQPDGPESAHPATNASYALSVSESC